MIKELYPGSPNSAGGVNLYVNFENISNKTFKYVIWEVVPYNAVGDPVGCEIRGRKPFKGRHTGPYKPGKTSPGGHFENAWYNKIQLNLLR